MKFLVIFSLLVASAVCRPQGHKNINRSEIKYPDGTASGSYTFVDEDGLTHEVQYNNGVDQQFKITSHVVTGDGRITHLSNGFTPEARAARKSHLALQTYLRADLPQSEDKEILPVYVRHVPSPVKQEPIVPILSVDPPQNVAVQRHTVSQVYHQEIPQRKVVIVNDIPPNSQYGRALYIENHPLHNSIQVKSQEIPVTFEEGIKSIPFEHQQQHVSIHKQQQQRTNKVSVERQHQPKFLAQNVQLVNGFTPEVASATKEHLDYVAALKAVLPPVDKE